MSVMIIEDFEKDIRDFILTDLPLSTTEKRTLEQQDTHTMILVHDNWSQRVIKHQSPKKVFFSQELTLNPEYINMKAIIDLIKEKFERGEDIKPHLSRLIKNVFSDQNKPLSKDKDLLVNDWGIYHLHLTDIIESDGFVERTDPLLFLKIVNNNVYFIDILEHGNWAAFHLVEVLQNNWPQVLEPFEFKDIKGLSRYVNEKEYKQLRNAGVNTIIKIGEKYYSVGLGTSTVGYDIQSSMRVNKFLKLLKNLRKFIEDKRYELQKIIKTHTKIEYNLLKFKLIFDDDGFYLLETNSKSRFYVDFNKDTIIIELGD